MKKYKLLVLLLVLAAPIYAEIAPWEYRGMQLRSPEQLTIYVNSVSNRRSLFSRSVTVRAKATVLEVLISRSNLQPGDEITIVYTHDILQKNWAGPRPIPLLKRKETTFAFLIYDEKEGFYTTAARGASFQQLIPE